MKIEIFSESFFLAKLAEKNLKFETSTTLWGAPMYGVRGLGNGKQSWCYFWFYVSLDNTMFFHSIYSQNTGRTDKRGFTRGWKFLKRIMK